MVWNMLKTPFFLGQCEEIVVFRLVSAACSQHCAKHTLPDLPYDYNALEPVISAEIMQLHHQKHHATYVNNLNIAEEKLAEAQAKSDLMHLIKSDFGSFENFKTQMSNMAVAVQGSGWAWLGFNTTTNSLQLSSCANQDPLRATTGLVPLFGIDVWEHAYYLQYKNVRPDYVKAMWNVVNWTDVSERLVEAQQNVGV
ncbi:superoxide dismutase [Mn], mitochondrial-like isoform X2 [Limulus polyphemus]|uniref:superoxide dismutase n=1 Tax=Limulus polyphemus TaxID=6850 RepID=A0ABM1SXA4_LIMPO|nr:superoxide dismutase [Mn], mitochondrial-like isoform X2 [Limulus polyphemus]